MIDEIFNDGAAFDDGRLGAGDQILKVINFASKKKTRQILQYTHNQLTGFSTSE